MKNAGKWLKHGCSLKLKDFSYFIPNKSQKQVCCRPLFEGFDSVIKPAGTLILTDVCARTRGGTIHVSSTY